jgi:hypothetical protein
MRSRLVAGLVLVLGVGAGLAGCTADSGQPASSGAYSGADAKQMAPEAPVGKESAPGAATDKAPAVASGQIAAERKLVRTAKIGLTAPDVKAAVDQARQIAVTAGGFTGAERTEAESASLTLSVPAERFDAVLGQLTSVPGTTVKTREQNAQDVTDQTVDVEARLATQRASVERVRALLARATSVSEITSIEGELTSRESELESLQRRRDSLAGSVAMSTVTLSVKAESAPTPPPPPDRSGFLGGLAGGWDAFLGFGGGLLTVVGAVAPFLLIGVPIGAVVWWLRRRRPAAPAAPAPTE